MGLFVVFEGLDGSGKSTQARRLYEALRSEGVSVALFHEPGGTVLGEEIRRLLKSEAITGITPLSELFLFAAARTQLIKEKLGPAITQNQVVVCDRFTASTVAYQGFGRGMSLEVVTKINDIATDGTIPDLTILLDISPEDAFERHKSRHDLSKITFENDISLGVNQYSIHDNSDERFEKEPLSFHRKVHEGYAQMAQADPQRWFVLDATLTPDALTACIEEKVKKLI
ncbi:MAG: dTMP kinase [Chloroflexi bacterium]|jgi:dTMP kinase|nr:MAG: dTMP kinase [Chloroflexota bacterium]